MYIGSGEDDAETVVIKQVLANAKAGSVSEESIVNQAIKGGSRRLIGYTHETIPIYKQIPERIVLQQWALYSDGSAETVGQVTYEARDKKGDTPEEVKS